MLGCKWIIVLCVVSVACTNAIPPLEPEFVEQREIDAFGEVIPYKSNLSIGESCINSGECISQCCKRTRRLGGRCAPRARKGDRCTNFQIKGGYYYEYCPCAAGEDHCGKNGRCH